METAPFPTAQSTLQSQAQYMQLAVSLARKSPPKPSNYCVGAVLVDCDSGLVVSTGFTLELPGNTHAEECCLHKLTPAPSTADPDPKPSLPERCALYTTLEPCSFRLSGNKPCADRLALCRDGLKGLQVVYVGWKEPGTFVANNGGAEKLNRHGIKYILVPGFEAEIQAIATSGHVPGIP